MSHRRALLIYDADCTYCRGFVRAMTLLDRDGRIAVLPLDASDVQSLLRAQFGDAIGFAMYLVERDRIYWGANAAERVPALLTWPRLIRRLAFWAYPTLVRVVSWLSRREREICGPGCALDGPAAERDHGTVEITDEARDAFRQLTGDETTADNHLQPRT